MKTCTICGKTFDPNAPLDNPSEQAGLHMARELYDDADQLCPQCLANRGTLGMMYCTEFYG